MAKAPGWQAQPWLPTVRAKRFTASSALVSAALLRSGRSNICGKAARGPPHDIRQQWRRCCSSLTSPLMLVAASALAPLAAADASAPRQPTWMSLSRLRRSRSTSGHMSSQVPTIAPLRTPLAPSAPHARAGAGQARADSWRGSQTATCNYGRRGKLECGGSAGGSIVIATRAAPCAPSSSSSPSGAALPSLEAQAAATEEGRC